MWLLSSCPMLNSTVTSWQLKLLEGIENLNYRSSLTDLWSHFFSMASIEEVDFRVVKCSTRLNSPLHTHLPTSPSASSLFKATTFLWESSPDHIPGYPGTFSSPSLAYLQVPLHNVERGNLVPDLVLLYCRLLLFSFNFLSLETKAAIK